jgi:glycosyltransferase involved in cell wall biosynthesis
MCVVSVIIPAYNAESTISSALDSVFIQNLDPAQFKIIIIDDGSQDATVQIVKKYKNKYPDRINLVRQKNAGPAAARNAGVALADTPYIAFLDADDRWLQGKLQAQIEVLNKNPGVALVCTPMNGKKFKSRSDLIKISYKSLLLSNRIYTSSVIVRKNVFTALGQFNPTRRLSEDYELWLKIAATSTILAINRPYLLYTKNTGISSKLWNMERGELETYRIIYNERLISEILYTSLRYWSLSKFFYRYLLTIQSRWSTKW